MSAAYQSRKPSLVTSEYKRGSCKPTGDSFFAEGLPVPDGPSTTMADEVFVVGALLLVALICRTTADRRSCGVAVRTTRGDLVDDDMIRKVRRIIGEGLKGDWT